MTRCSKDPTGSTWAARLSTWSPAHRVGGVMIGWIDSQQDPFARIVRTADDVLGHFESGPRSGGDPSSRSTRVAGAGMGLARPGIF
jgi:hypothetical protein